MVNPIVRKTKAVTFSSEPSVSPTPPPPGQTSTTKLSLVKTTPQMDCSDGAMVCAWQPYYDIKALMFDNVDCDFSSSTSCNKDPISKKSRIQ